MKNRFLNYWLLAFILKVIFCSLVDIVPDESYYWMWANRLDLSYFDHPGMVAWWASLSKSLAPSVWVRWPFLLIGHIGFYFVYKIILKLVPQESQLSTFQLNLFSPLLFFGSLIITPDAPFFFFWSLSLYLYVRALDNATLTNYSLVGAALGLGFCSKYMVVLFVPALILTLCFQSVRKKISWRLLPVTILFGLLFCTPVLFWNAHHDWISFKFQIEHGLGRSWKPSWTLDYAWVQPLIFSPFLFLSLFKKPNDLSKPLYFFALFPYLFFLYSTSKGFVEANWTMMALTPFYIAASTQLQHFRKWANWTFFLWSVVYSVALAAVVYFTLLPYAPPFSTKTQRYQGILEYTRTHSMNPQNTFFSTYQMSSIVSFKTHTLYAKLPGMNRFDDYDLRPLYSIPDHLYLFVQKEFKPKDHPVLKNYTEIQNTEIDSEFKVLELQKHE